jgi:hypothetical protein
VLLVIFFFTVFFPPLQVVHGGVCSHSVGMPSGAGAQADTLPGAVKRIEAAPKIARTHTGIIFFIFYLFGGYLKKTHSLFPVAEMAVNFLKGLQSKDKSVAIKTQRFFAILIKFSLHLVGRSKN